MKLKTKVKALTAAVALVAASGANASIDGLSDSAGNVGGSELVLTIFNFGLGVSETYDLFDGSNTLGWNDFDGNGAYSFDAFSSALLGQAGTVWTVTAVDNNFQGTSDLDPNGANWGRRIMTTYNNDVALGSMSADAAMAGDYVVGMNNQAGQQATADGSQLGITGGAGYWGLQMNTGFLPSLGVTAAVGSSMGFQLAAENYTVTEIIPGLLVDAQLTGIDQTVYAGTWSLDAGGTLTYGGVSAVPVPAAVWLFGSAMLGLVGVARRRTSGEAEALLA